MPEYSALDEFALSEEKQATHSEPLANSSSENSQDETLAMTDEDTLFISAIAVEKFEFIAKIYLDAPVELAEEQREQLAEKSSAVIKKWVPDGKLPSWFAKWKEEIELGLALGSAAFSFYKQKQEFDKESKNAPEKSENKANQSPVLTPKFAHDIERTYGN